MNKDGLFCSECLIKYTLKHGDVKLSHPELGEVVIKNILHYRCDNCGDMVILPEQALLVESEINRARVLNTLDSFKGRLNSEDISNELQLKTISVEKALIKLVREGLIEHKDMKMRLGARRYYSRKPKGFWQKVQKYFKKD